MSDNVYISRRGVLRGAAALAASTAVPSAFADAAGGVNVGMRAYTAIFPGGAGIHFDHAYYRDEHLAIMQRLYGNTLIRVEARRPLVPAGAPASSYVAFVNFWIPDAEAFAKASAEHGQKLVQDKAHFTNSEQNVQSETVFAEAGAAASDVRVGDQCLTVLYPYDAADRFDYDYYRDHHMTSLIKLYGREGIKRVEARKGLSSPDGTKPPLYACTANIYVSDPAVFAATASRTHERVSADFAVFTTVTPIAVMTEVVGAFDA